jgi:hypothetical protein
MSENKSKLRSLLDFLEDAGFSIASYREGSEDIDTDTVITIKPYTTNKMKTSEIIALFEDKYQILDFSTHEKYEGAIYIKIAPPRPDV